MRESSLRSDEETKLRGSVKCRRPTHCQTLHFSHFASGRGDRLTSKSASSVINISAAQGLGIPGDDDRAAPGEIANEPIETGLGRADIFDFHRITFRLPMKSRLPISVPIASNQHLTSNNSVKDPQIPSLSSNSYCF
jgi:hypothetical protein